MNKSLSILLIVIAGAAGGFAGFYGYKYLTPQTVQAPEQKIIEEKTETTASTTTEIPAEAAVEVEAETIDYSEKGLFDNCPGIKNYKNKPFYSDLVRTFELKETADKLFILDKDQFDIRDACYSEKLKKVILLAQIGYGEGHNGFKITVYNTETKKFEKTEWPEQDVFPAPDVFGLRKGREIELLADTKCGEFPFLAANSDPNSDELCGKDICQRAVYIYNLETKEIKKLKDEKYTPDLAYIKKNFPLYAEKYNLKCVLCKAEPEVTDIGSYWYPVAEKYQNNGLPEIFQADDCGGDRIYKIFGIENGDYWAGALIRLRDPYNSELINTLKSIGFTCATLNPENVCTEWELSKTVKVTELLKLKPFYKLFELLDCVNCG